MTYGPYAGIVDHVHDGDTVYVRLDVGFDITIFARVRVHAINAPELATAAGKAARDYALELLPPGSKVQVTSHGWDKYGGRVLGSLTFVPPVAPRDVAGDFATAMIAAGHAKPYSGSGPKP